MVKTPTAKRKPHQRRRGTKTRELALADNELEDRLNDILGEISPRPTRGLISKAQELIYEYRNWTKRARTYPDAASLHQQITNLAEGIAKLKLLASQMHKDPQRRFFTSLGLVRCDEEEPVLRVDAGRSEFARIMKDFGDAVQYARRRTQMGKRGPKAKSDFKQLILELALAWKRETSREFGWTAKGESTNNSKSKSAAGSTAFVRGVLQAGEIGKPGTVGEAPLKGWNSAGWSVYLDGVARSVQRELDDTESAGEASETSEDEAEDLEEEAEE